MGPTRRSAIVAGAIWGIFFAGSLVDTVIDLALPWDRMPPYLNLNNNTGATGVIGTLAMLAFVTVAALLIWRRPANRVGWLLCAIPFSAILPLGSIQTYFGLAWYLHPGTYPPGADVLFELSSVTWWIPFTLMLVVLPLIFPSGRLVSPRWAWVFAGVAIYGLAFMFAALTPQPGTPPGMRNPFLVPGLQRYVPIALTLFTPAFLACIVAATASAVVRYRRGSSEERHQLKWVAAAFGLVAATFVLEWLVPGLQNSGIAVLPLVICAIPVAIGVAVLRYRLYDVDVVINRSLVFGALALFIGGVYVLVVVGIGRLVGTGNRPNLVLSILATALVAIAFQPVRERVEAIANRVVYGQRLSPYDALVKLSQHASVERGQEVLNEMARVLAQGTSAESATVWLRIGAELRPAAAWPAGMDRAMARADRSVPVDYQGEVLGALAIHKPAGEQLTSLEEGLLADMSAQAGLVLHNVRLDAELRRRLDQIARHAEELRESRRRIVAAQDQERRRLERNIHDGAQQHLVALSVKLRLAATLAERNPDKAETLLVELKQDAAVARQTLHELASGIYSPVLREKGIGPALRANTVQLPFNVNLRDALTARYRDEQEVAVYFCCLEALQNVAKYAGAEHAWVALEERSGRLHFEVRDDGRGFESSQVTYGSGLRNMADRLAALGGELRVDSKPASGTLVAGWLPARQPAPAGQPG